MHRHKLSAKQMWLARKNSDAFATSDDWLRGFIEAEGTFTQNNKTMQPLFQITPLGCEDILMWAIKDKIGKGRIHNNVRKGGRHCVVYSLSNKQHISQHLPPLLRKGFVLSKARLGYHTWLQTHFSSHWLEYKVGKTVLDVSCDLSA